MKIFFKAVFSIPILILLHHFISGETPWHVRMSIGMISVMLASLFVDATKE